MFNFLHTFTPNPVLLTLGPITIHWYGFFIVLGIFLGIFTVLQLADFYEYDRQNVYDFCFYTLIFGIVGDRLYYVLYAWEFYKQDFWSIFKIWEGGLAIHGGIIAGAITLYIFSHYSKTNEIWRLFAIKKKWISSTSKSHEYFWFILDLCVVILFIGLAFGRWGNYFNQELFGKPTSLPWGIPIETQLRPSQYTDSMYFHPTFLYESIADCIVFLFLIFLHRKRLALFAQSMSTHFYTRFGNIFLTGLGLYSFIRFCNEFLRTDYTPFVWGIRWAQIASTIIFIICITFLWRRNFSGVDNKKI